LVRGFLSTKEEKVFRNNKRSATGIPVIKLPVVIENSLQHSHIDFFLQNLRAVGEEEGDVSLLIYGKKWSNSVRNPESSGIRLGYVIIANFSSGKTKSPI